MSVRRHPELNTLRRQHLGRGFRALHWSVPVSLGLFESAGRMGEEEAQDTVINLLFQGAYRVRSARGEGLVDPNRWVFFERHSPYDSVPLGGQGRRGSYLRFHPAVVDEMLEDLDPDRVGHGFPCTTAPIQAAHLRRWHRLLQCVHWEDGTEIEEPLLLLGADILQSTLAVGRGRPDRLQQVLAVQEQLNADPARRTSLRALGARVGLSAFQLARGFRDHLGTSVHQYRDQLRLNLAAARLSAAPDLADLALSLGYTTHSHFTARFRRRFGCPPSRFLTRAARS